MKVSIAWYVVKDFEAAKKFYGETLGLKKIFEMPGWAEFGHQEGAATIGISTMPGSSGGATVVLAVDDLNSTMRRLTSKGVRFEGEVQEIPEVVRIATFKDPAGNVVQLAQSLFAN
ncbi:MAG: VOC family protein [Bryobacteraceae bacterium]